MQPGDEDGIPARPRKSRLPGGLSGHALLTGVVCVVLAGIISFFVARWQSQDAASQAHAAQVADGASQVESAAESFYDTAEALYTARRQCAAAEHSAGTVPPGCPPSVVALINSEAVLGAAYSNTADPETLSLLRAFSLAAHDDLAQAGDLRGGPYAPDKMTSAYYALVARCGQLIRER
jgi:hypothetical protein